MGDSTFHATLSPSARHRWGACPGSVREEAKYPEPSGGAAANDGTRTHTLLEQFIKEGKYDIGYPDIGKTFTDEFGTFTLDAERANRLNVALGYIRTRVAESGTTPIPEQRVHPDGYVGRADMSGTVDVQLPGKDIYEIIDYKDGMAPVEAKDNPQLEQYAIGAMAGLDQTNLPKSFQVTIIQPRLSVKGMPVISSHNIPTKLLLARADVLKAEAAATDEPDAPLVPGESQCKYCKAKGACPALATKAMNEVGMMFSAVPAITPEVLPPDLDPAHQAAAKDPTMMDDNQLRQIQESAPLVRQMLEGVEAEILRRLTSGRPVPGFKLVEGRGSRKWSLPEEEMVKKLTAMGIPKGSIYETTLVSPAKAEKLVWEKKGEPQKLSDVQLKRMGSEYVTKTVGKLTVAPESDSRPAVVSDASPMFSPVEPVVAALPPFLSPPPVPAALPDWLK